MKETYAHSLADRPTSDWETLDTHAEKVAVLARLFAAAFNAGDWGELLGRWHDLGKASIDFQARINPDAGEEAAGKVDHSTFGARYAKTAFPHFQGHLLAFCIAGHHAGLTDARPTDDATTRSTLQFRLDPEKYTIPAVDKVDAKPAPVLKIAMATPAGNELGFALAFFTRMLFSALIDADRTATVVTISPICNQAFASITEGLGSVRGCHGLVFSEIRKGAN